MTRYGIHKDGLMTITTQWPIIEAIFKEGVRTKDYITLERINTTVENLQGVDRTTWLIDRAIEFGADYVWSTLTDESLLTIEEELSNKGQEVLITCDTLVENLGPSTGYYYTGDDRDVFIGTTYEDVLTLYNEVWDYHEHGFHLGKTLEEAAITYFKEEWRDMDDVASAIESGTEFTMDYLVMEMLRDLSSFYFDTFGNEKSYGDICYRIERDPAGLLIGTTFEMITLAKRYLDDPETDHSMFPDHCLSPHLIFIKEVLLQQPDWVLAHLDGLNFPDVWEEVYREVTGRQ